MSKKVKTHLMMKSTNKLRREVEKTLAENYGDPNKSLEDILKEQEEKQPYLVFGMPVKEYQEKVEARIKEIKQNENTR